MATWYTVALLREPFLAPFRGLIDLANGVMLGSIPDWLRAAEMETEEQPNLRWPYVRAVTGLPMFVLFQQYDAEGPDDLDDTWNDPDERMTKGRTASDRLMVANLAVWLVQPKTTLRFGDVLHVGQRADGAWRIRSLLHPAPFRPEVDRAGTPTLTGDHLAEVRVLNGIIGGLTRHGPLWTALRSLWGALTEGWFHNRYMLLWIAMEALFGPKGRSEITRRLARNLSLFMAANAQEQTTLWAAARQDYDQRSGIAHGEIGRVQRTEWVELILRAEDWLRPALVRILRDRDLRETFSDQTHRQVFFANLANAAGLATPEDF
ncbi:MAG: hypothetical protein HY002_06895 [Candidatus Rokubacteria bacterium]|nr:hypothetical protein [Candidatus Rokubacteria bacterium]